MSYRDRKTPRPVLQLTDEQRERQRQLAAVAKHEDTMADERAAVAGLKTLAEKVLADAMVQAGAVLDRAHTDVAGC